MNPKERAARAALRHVHSGMVLGLGTGSTARIFIDLLGDELRAGRLSGVRGIPTSVQSDEQARSLGITLTDFAAVAACDVTIDGADEVTPDLTLIKGLGGALLREKVVAQQSRRLIIIADDSKWVTALGSKAPVPVEVTPFARAVCERFLPTLGCTPTLRASDDGKPYLTDNGNLIFDCRFPSIADAAATDTALRAHAGVVETGLFVGLAALAIVATADGVREVERPSR